MRVRIVNTGQPSHMTQVTNAETGEQLDLQVTKVIIDVKREIPMATLVSIAPTIDLVALGILDHVCPHCGQRSEVEL